MIPQMSAIVVYGTLSAGVFSDSDDRRVFLTASFFAMSFFLGVFLIFAFFIFFTFFIFETSAWIWLVQIASHVPYAAVIFIVCVPIVSAFDFGFLDIVTCQSSYCQVYVTQRSVPERVRLRLQLFVVVRHTYPRSVSVNLDFCSRILGGSKKVIFADFFFFTFTVLDCFVSRSDGSFVFFVFTFSSLSLGPRTWMWYLISDIFPAISITRSHIS